MVAVYAAVDHVDINGSVCYTTQGEHGRESLDAVTFGFVITQCVQQVSAPQCYWYLPLLSNIPLCSYTSN